MLCVAVFCNERFIHRAIMMMVVNRARGREQQL